MKKLIILMLLPVFLWAGNAIAFDLTGTWDAYSECVPGGTYSDPDLDPDNFKWEETKGIKIRHNKQSGFFTTFNARVGKPDEICGGVVDDEGLIHMTCPGTIFHGEFIGKKPHRIVGINHNPDDGATCTVEAEKLPD